MNYKFIKQLAQQYEIVLGSKSPRRVTLLKETGINFSQIISHLEEKQQLNESPFDFAQRLAQDKAMWVAKQVKDKQLVIGCDTIVILGNQVLGKPVDKEDAFKTLSTLIGKQHIVCTALALASKGKILAYGYELTNVFFKKASEEQLRNYIITGEPQDKAGAYGIQGMGGFLVDRIEGNLDNVIGLPRQLLNNLAKEVIEESKINN
ncbi:MAG: septum formation protein Maf [FCB group bacterium]|nr:septum formation protein Maf [FCB group bacterium]